MISKRDSLTLQLKTENTTSQAILSNIPHNETRYSVVIVVPLIFFVLGIAVRYRNVVIYQSKRSMPLLLVHRIQSNQIGGHFSLLVGIFITYGPLASKRLVNSAITFVYMLPRDYPSPRRTTTEWNTVWID